METVYSSPLIVMEVGTSITILIPYIPMSDEHNS